jgi:hypothetical protein
MRIDSAIITGSFSVNGDTFNDLGVFPSTGSNTFVGNQNIVGVVSASAFTGSINYTNLTNVPTLVSGSEQIVSILSPLNSYTQSNDTTNTTQNSRLTSLESITGSLATTGSNTFIGTQTITGSLYISSDLIVQGSSSLQNITASAVSIGTNIINLNTANPAIRYAGLVIGDSGSVGGSGSFLYDSVQDEMLFIHRGDSSVVTSSVALMGPETYDNVGNEIYLTGNIIPKGTGKEHLVDSCIFDNGTTICVNATLKASGQVCGIMSTFSCAGIGTITPSNGRLEIQQTACSPGLWVQTGGTTSASCIASFRTGTNLSALEIYGNGNSVFGNNVSIGQVANPIAALHVTTTAGGTPTIPTLGNINCYVAQYITNGAGGGTYGLMTGTLFNGNAWMQVQRSDGTATAYNLVLQPNGGNVGINNSSPYMPLTVSGCAGIDRLAINCTGFNGFGEHLQVKGCARFFGGQLRVSNGGGDGNYLFLYHDDNNAYICVNRTVYDGNLVISPYSSVMVGTNCAAFGRRLTVQGDMVAYFSASENITMGISAGTGAQSWGIQVCDTGDGSNTLHLNARGGFVGINKGVGGIAEYSLDVSGNARITGTGIFGGITGGNLYTTTQRLTNTAGNYANMIHKVQGASGAFSQVVICVSLNGAGGWGYIINGGSTAGGFFQSGGGYTNGTGNYSHSSPVGGGYTVSSPASDVIRFIGPGGVHPFTSIQMFGSLQQDFGDAHVCIYYS